MADTLGALLERALLERALTVTDLARAIGISHSMVSNYINGKQVPRRATVRKIAAFFGVSSADVEAWLSTDATSPTDNAVARLPHDASATGPPPARSIDVQDWRRALEVLDPQDPSAVTRFLDRLPPPARAEAIDVLVTFFAVKERRLRAGWSATDGSEGDGGGESASEPSRIGGGAE